MGFKAVAVSALAVIASCALVACGSDDKSKASGDGASKSGEPLKVAFLYYLINDFSQVEADGAAEVAKKSGGSLKTFNANYDPQVQGKQCTDAITSGRYNAIILGTVTSGSSTACVRQAKAAGIPLVAIDIAIGPDPTAIEPQVDGVVASVVQGMKTNADGVSDLVKQACEGKDPCNAIMEIATPTDDLTNMPVKAVKAGQAGSNVKVVGTFASGYDPAQVTKMLPDLLTAHPDTDIIVSIGDNTAMAAAPIVKDAGKDILITGDGGSRAGARGVKEGILFGTLGLWPRQAGVAAAEAALAAVNGKTIAQPGIDQFKQDTPFLIKQDNVDQFKAEWGAE